MRVAAPSDRRFRRARVAPARRRRPWAGRGWQIARLAAVLAVVLAAAYHGAALVLSAEALTVTRLAVSGNVRMSRGEVVALLDGLLAVASETGTTVAGGDITRAPVLSLAVTVVGGWRGVRSLLALALTLGVVVNVTLKLFPLPEHRRLETIRFDSVGDGIGAMREIMRSGLRRILQASCG